MLHIGMFKTLLPRKWNVLLNMWSILFWMKGNICHNVKLKLHFPSVRNSIVNAIVSDARWDYHSIFFFSSSLLFAYTKHQLYALCCDSRIQWIFSASIVGVKRLHFVKEALQWWVRLSFWTDLTRSTCEIQNSNFYPFGLLT